MSDDFYIELTDKQKASLSAMCRQTGLSANQILDAFIKTRIFAEELDDLINDSNKTEDAYRFFLNLLNKVAVVLNHDDVSLPS